MPLMNSKRNTAEIDSVLVVIRNITEQTNLLGA